MNFAYNNNKKTKTECSNQLKNRLRKTQKQKKNKDILIKKTVKRKWSQKINYKTKQKFITIM